MGQNFQNFVKKLLVIYLIGINKLFGEKVAVLILMSHKQNYQV
ncbi:unnamed protein product [Paramecium octaurelia]|uniref:Uncharacterized protein n=1 Tax=Paramecium octaurelia TaxID=43137 RepID=A0A8S1S7Q1_PAROT|nr:unnamed protein product [Paramecium octaurelia]